MSLSQCRTGKKAWNLFSQCRKTVSCPALVLNGLCPTPGMREVSLRKHCNIDADASPNTLPKRRLNLRVTWGTSWEREAMWWILMITTSQTLWGSCEPPEIGSPSKNKPTQSQGSTSSEYSLLGKAGPGLRQPGEVRGELAELRVWEPRTGLTGGAAHQEWGAWLSCWGGDFPLPARTLLALARAVSPTQQEAQWI